LNCISYSSMTTKNPSGVTASKQTILSSTRKQMKLIQYEYVYDNCNLNNARSKTSILIKYCWAVFFNPFCFLASFSIKTKFDSSLKTNEAIKLIYLKRKARRFDFKANVIFDSTRSTILRYPNLPRDPPVWIQCVAQGMQ
jgi:hypothetical protein